MAADRNEIVNWSTTQFRRLRRWGVLGGFGGLLLFSAFFMPAVKGCSSPVIPAEHVWDALDDLPSAIGDWSSFLDSAAAAVSIGWPYLFGLLIVIICLRGWRCRHAAEQNLGISVAVLVGCLSVPLAISFVAYLITHGAPWGQWNSWSVFFALVACASPLYLLRSIRMGVAGLLCLRWYAALCGFVWFGMFLILGGFGQTYYGLWLSMVALILILVSTHAEARLRTRRTGLQTCWGLLRCRLQLHDLDGPRCFGCGYLLIGLPTNRCPECGREFDPAEYGLDAETSVLHSITSEDH